MSAPIHHLSIWQKPVFLLNSRLGLFTAAPFPWRPFSLSYGTNLPSSLTTLLPLALEFSSHLPVSVCGTGALDIHKAFLALRPNMYFPTKFRSLTPGATIARCHLRRCPLALILWRLRNIYRMCIDYAFRPRLSSRLTWSGRTFLQKP